MNQSLLFLNEGSLKITFKLQSSTFLIRLRFKGTLRVNQSLLFLNEGSLKITFKVPRRCIFIDPRFNIVLCLIKDA